MSDTPAIRRRWLAAALRLFVLAVVCLAIQRTFRHALDELSRYEWELLPGWLVLSGVLYGIGLAPMAWFWHRTLGALGQPAPWLAAFRAYYLGHLGKYVPGKALAVILRVAAVKKWVPSIRIALVSGLLETLTMMAVGACLAAGLTLVVLQLEPHIAALAAAMAIAAGVPTIPPIARWLARLGIARLKDDADLPLPPVPADVGASLHGINVRLLASGWVAAGVCWLLLGLSLWAVLRGIGVEMLDPLSDLPRLVAAVAFAVVAGFLSMLPGGLVVRDALLMRLLAPICGEANALVAAVMLRLVWLLTEISVCGILYVARSREQAVSKG